VHTHHNRHANPALSGSNGWKMTMQRPDSGGKGLNRRSVTAEEIRIRAYRNWERAGRPVGDGIGFWLDAEQELMRGE